MYDRDRIPFHYLHRTRFSIYSSDEIKKLSVKEITNVNTFDTLNHPTVGGLYDPALGPNERDENCSTCGLIYLHCPGHIGHINFPLPVFNPLFIRNLHQIMQGSCFNCHHLLAPPCAKQLALLQFQALDYGLVLIVQELEEAACDLSFKGIDKDATGVQLKMKEKLQSIFENAVRDLDLVDAKKSARVRNVVECRERIRKNFIKKHLQGGKGKCPICGVRRRSLALRQESEIIFCGPKRNINETGREEEQNEPEINRYLTAVEARKQLLELWNTDKDLLQGLYGILNDSDRSEELAINTFFFDNLIVPPIRFRPLLVVSGRKFMNPKSAGLKDVLQESILLSIVMKYSQSVTSLSTEEMDNVSRLPGSTTSDKLIRQWNKLQRCVNCMLDSDLDRFNKNKPFGVKQVLEKKEGLFRKHMMGKRVNYVARSVISPDPYIMVDEVGVPEIFAKKLTYPEPVSDWNYDRLQEAVRNGPDIHPGAFKIENQDGTVVRLNADDPAQRRALARQLMTPSPRCSGIRNGPKIVHRHLKNGDFVLLNRQPTLHKPSIMSHRARVLPGEKTIRLHYANCKSYNADFDGDEMNLHFPQNEITRSESYNIASVNHQYLVPKDGTPLTGLIQDHTVSATLLTLRGCMFNRREYFDLLNKALPFVYKKEKLLPPCIWKPEALWSGKQVVSTVILNLIPEGKLPPTLEGKAKISPKNWQNNPAREWKAGGTPLNGDDMTESQVIIHQGELLCGVLDKAHVGATPNGLIHCCYELYGGRTSTVLLSAFGLLFTYFLKLRGFSVGLGDLLLTSDATKRRRRVLRKARKVGNEVIACAFNISNPEDRDELRRKFHTAHLSRDSLGLKILDFEMKKKTDTFNNEVNKICVPGGLKKSFPENNLQLMVQSGSKGSTVNAMQISGLLGQMELEGRRVPLMMSGRSLPCFLPYDTSPRAGGFVASRFLTGLKPDEYFFHCMAGREGLIDTAVKTSRSGYLQRCLVKHLEGVVVNYDLTVRDSDGSVIQFLYGEDGLDVTKMQMLKKDQLSFLAQNYSNIINEKEVKMVRDRQPLEDPEKLKKSISRWQKKHKDISKKYSSAALSYFNDVKHVNYFQPFDCKSSQKVIEGFLKLDKNLKKRYLKSNKRCPDPVNSHFRPDLTFGSISEEMNKIIEDYIKSNPCSILCDKTDVNKYSVSALKKTISSNQFRDMCYYRAMRSIAQPGEAVGMLAAQSIGEPSTQMTLNTFHFAGRGEMNVTLGIPRLREILMFASSNISTPTMDLPLLKKVGIEVEAEKLKVKLTAVKLNQVVKRIQIDSVLRKQKKKECSLYQFLKIRMKFLPYKVYAGELNVTPPTILKYIEEVFIKQVIRAVRNKLNGLHSTYDLIRKPIKREVVSTVAEVEDENITPGGADVNLDEGASSGEDDDGDGDTLDKKVKDRHNQEQEYEDPEEDDALNDASDEDMEMETVVKEEVVEEYEDCEMVEASTFCDNLCTTLEKEQRIAFVQNIDACISDYDYDVKRQRWCAVTFQVPRNKELDLRTLIEDEIQKSVVYKIPQIKRAFVVHNPNSIGSDEKMLKTDGVNFLEVFKYHDIIDINKASSNDIHSIANIYGIEAARRVIVKEVANVFATYGITVDSRHLLLIADYMTYSGQYKPFNRSGIESNPSPFQKMTFETSTKFLKNAILTGSVDLLNSPSSRIIVGQPVRCGTGFMDLFIAPPEGGFVFSE